MIRILLPHEADAVKAFNEMLQESVLLIHERFYVCDKWRPADNNVFFHEFMGKDVTTHIESKNITVNLMNDQQKINQIRQVLQNTSYKRYQFSHQFPWIRYEV